MSKKNQTIEGTFNFALKNLQKGKFKVADDLFKKVLKKNSKHLYILYHKLQLS